MFLLFVSGSRGFALYIKCHDVILFELDFFQTFRFDSLILFEFMVHFSIRFTTILLPNWLTYAYSSQSNSSIAN